MSTLSVRDLHIPKRDTGGIVLILRNQPYVAACIRAISYLNNLHHIHIDCDFSTYSHNRDLVGLI